MYYNSNDRLNSKLYQLYIVGLTYVFHNWLKLKVCLFELFLQINLIIENKCILI